MRASRVSGSLADGHVSVDILTARLGRRAQHTIIAANALVCAALMVLIAVQMGLLAAEFLATSRTTLTARIRVFPFMLPVTAVAAVAALAFLLQALGAAARALRPELPPLPSPAP